MNGGMSHIENFQFQFSNLVISVDCIKINRLKRMIYIKKIL